MGGKQNGPFRLSFNASLKVDFQGFRVTSDGGLILVRELDERLGTPGQQKRSQGKDCTQKVHSWWHKMVTSKMLAVLLAFC